ncbi:helix-turn-helix domain-containing protein [Agromyces sp. NPDC055520]
MGNVVEFTPVTSKPLWRHALGGVLRRERQVQERILTEVAAAAGVSPQYLSEIERGRKEPSSEVLGSVAEALGLDLVDVVQRVGATLGERREAERREAERRELLRIEASFAFRVGVEHGGAEPDGRATPAGPVAYLLAA